MNMDLQAIRMRWRSYYKKHGVSLLVGVGLLGIGCIALSDWLPASHASQAPSAQTEASALEQDYALLLEQRLGNLLMQLEGVGHAQVMVTVSSTAAQIYAEEIKASENDRGSQSEQHPVITRKNGDEAPLIEKTEYPVVQGVIVLCSGGHRAAIKEQVIKAVSTVLNIPAADIYVGKYDPNYQSP